MTAAACAEGSDFDSRRLDQVLRSRVTGLLGTMHIERIGGGRSNPTYFVHYDNRSLVLRKQPPGPLLASAHAINREFRILQALEISDVPVPAAIFFEEDPTVVGTLFYVMDRVEGRVFGDPTLPSVSVVDRRHMIMASAEVLARLHRLFWTSMGVSDFGRPDNFYARQVARWARQWHLSSTCEMPDIEILVTWLQSNVPDSQTSSIVHGDFRLNNLIFHPTEPRVVAVLDWELCTIGHPLADVAYFSLMWKLGSDGGLGFSDRNISGLGIPEEQQWLSHYTAFCPGAQPPSAFHFVFALFRLAVIAQGVGHRATQGTAASEDASQFGSLSGVFAQRARELLDRTTG